MGSIIYIEKNPKKWKTIDSGSSLKQDLNEKLLKITYGEFDDDPIGTYDIDMLMRKSVYDKLISGEYHIEDNTGKLKEGDFCVIDKNNNLVNPMSDGLIY